MYSFYRRCRHRKDDGDDVHDGDVASALDLVFLLLAANSDAYIINAVY